MGKRACAVAIALALVAAWICRGHVAWALRRCGIVESRTVDSVLAEHGARVASKFREPCERAGILWPPAAIQLIAVKEERQLEVWVGRVRLAMYPILGASGGPGPKRREGDRQVPEGFYDLTTLNPNSAFHLSIRVDYPNAEDVAHAGVPREQMGGDIYIHGGRGSIGCIAVGNEAIEEVFCLAALARERSIIIAPRDFRTNPDVSAPEPWVGARYERLRGVMDGYRR